MVKAAGLDWMTTSDTVYQVSIRLPPRIIAIKQIIQLGIKFIDPKVVEDNRYNIRRTDTDSYKPFWKVFISEFEKLPQSLRESIVRLLEPNNKANIDRIKSMLKSFFLKQIYPTGEPAPNRIDTLVSKHIYSYLVVEERKRKRVELQEKNNLYTPTAKRNLLSSKLNRNLLSKCLAPRVSMCPKAKRACLNPDSLQTNRGPGKHKLSIENTPTREVKRHKRTHPS